VSPPFYLDLKLSSVRWSESLVLLHNKIEGLSEAAFERFVARARRAAGLRGTVDVLVTHGAEMRSLNRRFRGKDRPTDVLSFPSLAARFNGRRDNFAGDIAICSDIAIENAARFGHAAGEEIRILTLHGILHLAGFDHERDNGAMARKEAQLRQILNLPSALIERAHTGNSHLKKKRRKRHRAGAAKV
jgi:probable rRNA maturation factor